LDEQDQIFVNGDGSATAPEVPPAPPLDEEPEQHVPGSFLQALPQFFVFPLILVATLTLAYLGLRLLVGSEPTDASALIADIRGAGGTHSRAQAMHRLADGLRREKVTLAAVPASELAALYESYAQDSPQTRQFLLKVLQWKQAPELTAIAVGALSDPEPDVRLAALLALGLMDDPEAVPALAAHLSAGSHEERFMALGALARIGNAPALDAVAGMLGDDDTILHRNAVIALGGAQDGRAALYLPGLLHRSGYDADPALLGEDADLLDEASRAEKRAFVTETLLVNAVKAAGKLGDPAMIPQLEELRANDPSVKVRSAAINALHDLGTSPDPEQ
jgi:hypothetical protein